MACIDENNATKDNILSNNINFYMIRPKCCHYARH